MSYFWCSATFLLLSYAFFYWEYCFSLIRIAGFRSKESLSVQVSQRCCWVLILSLAASFFHATILKTWYPGLQRVKAFWKLTCKASIQMWLLAAVSMDVERAEARTLITLIIWSNCSHSSQVSQGKHHQQLCLWRPTLGKDPAARCFIHGWRL